MSERSGSLHAAALSRAYAGIRALDDVTITVNSHEVVGLIGPNGAGKSTLVNLLSAFDFPTTGSVLLDGIDITTWPAHRRVRAGLARTFQHGHAFPGLTARENVEVAALGSGASAKSAHRRARELLELLGIADHADADASSLAHGDERLLGVARALATEPKFVLLDEPAAGLNEDEIGAFADTIRLLRNERQAGVLLIDHNVPLVLGVCDRIHVLDQGVTLAEGTPAEIRSHPAVAEAYLGGTAAA
ncbi:MAG: ABC transporter ATP-binding protein [Actinomycetota bacterium]|nr:ABC transporter ATP-binding protein [Actinomycetota bacterium]